MKRYLRGLLSAIHRPLMSVGNRRFRERMGTSHKIA